MTIQKALVVTAILFTLPLATAQQVEVFPNTYEVDVVAGETYDKEISVQWEGNNPANITLTNIVEAEETSSKGVTTSYTPSQIELQPKEVGTFDITVNTSTYLKPDNFTITSRAKSVTESKKSSETKTTNISNNKSTSIDVGTVNLNITPESDANVTASSLTEPDVDTNPGQGKTFLGGVQASVTNNSGNVDTSATIKINYNQNTIFNNNLDEDSLKVYYHQDGSNQWSLVGGNVNKDKNFVEVKASKFSTYALYGDQQTSDDTTDSSDSTDTTDSEDNTNYETNVVIQNSTTNVSEQNIRDIVEGIEGLYLRNGTIVDDENNTGSNISEEDINQLKQEISRLEGENIDLSQRNQELTNTSLTIMVIASSTLTLVILILVLSYNSSRIKEVLKKGE